MVGNHINYHIDIQNQIYDAKVTRAQGKDLFYAIIQNIPTILTIEPKLADTIMTACHKFLKPSTHQFIL